ncbi:hypothetical protein FNV43_RR24541 [Rhamnella rubrinervis]|uniref:Uncharacterized protein n=1 Tax=Rhamnella rubrinervis TaxID=2594499 RepID=A0A8K0DSG2_9ROSA|nr:hypothetical protein FNV43_RR24541 [Rhamnella rubrinervis]
MGTDIRSTSDLGAAPNRTYYNTNVGKNVQIISDNDIVENECSSLQGEDSSKPSQDFDGTSYVGQHSNSMVMVPFNSSSSLATAQLNLDLVALYPSVSETTDKDLWNIVKRELGRPKKGEIDRRLQLLIAELGLTKPFT